MANCHKLIVCKIYGDFDSHSKVLLNLYAYYVTEGGDTVAEDTDRTVTSEVNLTTSHVVYKTDVWPPVPVKEQTDEGEGQFLWVPPPLPALYEHLLDSFLV